jgi:AMP-activated protein kinase-like protein
MMNNENNTKMEAALRSLHNQALPSLDLDFTQKVMERLKPPSLWQEIFGKSHLPLKLALGTALTAGLVLGLYFGPSWQRSRDIVATAPMPSTAETPAQKIYQVRFSLKRPEASEVKVLGDFTQWNAMAMVKDGQGNFTGEVTLPEGTYAYGFVVDGKEWVPDQTAHGFAPDGFGRVNSIINL